MSKEIKEAIEFIETIFAIADNDEPKQTKGEPEPCFQKIKRLSSQALTLLKQQPTAGKWTKKIRSFVKMYENEIPKRAEITFLKEVCDIIDQLKSQIKAKDELLFAYKSVRAPKQPTASEFTKEARQTAKNVYAGNPKLLPSKGCLSSYINELCDRLDTAEAENKELKDTLAKSFNEAAQRLFKEGGWDKLKAKLDTAEALNKDLLEVLEYALVSLTVISMPRQDNNVATDTELLKIMGDSFRAAIAKTKQ